MSNFSKEQLSKDPKTTFKKHHVYEVSHNLTESKHIADDYSNTHRYQHRAHVVIVGSSALRPYDPIYLDGLPNGMSGYWVVLSVKHIFGGRPANYMVELEVGTDVLGDTDPQAKLRADTRDIQSDLAEQSLSSSDSSLSDYSLSPNQNSIVPDYGTTDLTANNAVSAVGVPSGNSITMTPTSSPTAATPYRDGTPNLKGVKRTVQWASKASTKVVK
jgi:hypothetical protein